MFNFKWSNLVKCKQPKKHQQVINLCQQLYQHIPSFTLAKQAREIQQQFSYEYIYGEIDFTSFIQLLSFCHINKESVFYDLGSGVGKAVICAALLYDFKKVCGVEQLQLLHQYAQKIVNQLPQKNIFLYQADLLTVDLSEASLVFINASAFIGDFWQQVLAKLKQLKSGTQLIIVSKQLPADSFTLVYSDFLTMSWGLARVGCYTAKP